MHPYNTHSQEVILNLFNRWLGKQDQNNKDGFPPLKNMDINKGTKMLKYS